MVQNEFMTKGEVARMLRVTPRTIENYVNKGALSRPLKMGGRALWRRAEVLSRMEAAPAVPALQGVLHA